MKKLFSILLCMFSVTIMSAQNFIGDDSWTRVDSVAVEDAKVLGEGKSVVVSEENAKEKKLQRDWSTWRPNPKKALWLSLIPGGGQIYNRKFWKLPIIYGGFLGCIYAWRWNGQMYNDYKQAYADITDDDPETKSYETFLHLGAQVTEENASQWENLFKKRKDRYRRYRDLSIFCLIGVYAISIIDAYVDASLSEFDISDDLTLKISPAVMDSKGHSMMTSRSPLENSALGVNCKLSF